VDLSTDDIDLVVNCHLHFDHIGGNPSFAGRPIYCQRNELETARSTDYTVTELVDFTGVRYELLDGEAEIAPGVHVIPTPGHVDGHQSVVLECDDGSIVLAGQAHDTASEWSADALAARASEIGHEPPLPKTSPWMARLLAFDPRRVVFAHDAAVWIP
jgi:N-acyl homoserine lactone hydrolase